MKARVAVLTLTLCGAAAFAAGPEIVRKFKPVTFAETSPLAKNGELIERLFSPQAHADLVMKNTVATLNDFSVDPKQESFGLFVPAKKPSGGYGVIVWISPLEQVGMPRGWSSTLEERGVIFVTAARSGNETSTLGRRVPLALIAVANILRGYAVDPDRVWIAGFSGGSRVAERVALAYPEIFAGAILDGSSDPIGARDVPLPPRKRFEQLLDRTSIVLSAGELDRQVAEAAKRVASGFRRHCLERVAVEIRRGEAHIMMDARSLGKAIEFLDRPRESPSAKNRQCRNELYSRIETKLAKVDAEVRRGNRQAITAIQEIDRKFGWLAAPQTLELRARLGG